MLAMGVNDNAAILMPRGVSSSIASMLAPTGVKSPFSCCSRNNCFPANSSWRHTSIHIPKS